MRRAVKAAVVAAGLVTAMVVVQPVSAADNPYQRGPDPTVQSVAANRGTFATSSVSVPPGNGFNGGMIYYPTDTSLGTWGAMAIVPGYTARFANEEAWMGPWLASFGFVVIGVETNSLTDNDSNRGTQLLAALDYLTQQSSVRDRVDRTRLGVIGHSMGGGGAISAAERRPSLKAAVPLAPYSPSQNLATDQVPTMIISGQNDTVVTPSYLDGLYATMPAATQSAFVEIAGVDHLFATRPNTTEMRLLIPWIKIFIDNDTRYTQFLCPSLADPSGISRYRSKCPYVPPGGTPPPPPPPTSALVNVPSGRCVDVPNSSTNNGTQVQLWDCRAGANQRWTYTSSKQLTVYGNKCLGASGRGTANGTAVVIWDCDGDANQQWNFNSNGSITGVQSGLCLDAAGAGAGNGTRIQLWSCHGGSNQQWSLRN
jgi:dienelactone hydrolase